MYQTVNLSEKIFYVGVNDRRTSLFENLWPLERGVAYNSYLIDDEKVTLIDTVEIGFIDKFLQKVRSVIGDRDIDYLVINHMEPDHAGAVQILTELYPKMQIVGNKKTIPMVDGFFGIDNDFVEVGEGSELKLGANTLKFHMAPMVHWPETMVTYLVEQKIIFSGDAFGSFGSLDGGIFDDEIDFEYFRDEMRRYYSNIVGKYGVAVQKILSKLGGLDIKMIAATHGPIIRQRVAEIIDMYDAWSKYEAGDGVVIAYASMYGHTEEMAEVVARELAVNGVKNIRMYDVSKTHASYIISDIFKYKGVIFGSPTYNSQLHPGMESLVAKLENMGVSNHYMGIFGSFTWAGTAVKKLVSFAENVKWELVADSVEQKQALKADKYEACRVLGKAMAEKLKA